MRPRAKRQADPEFARAPADREREHSENAHRGEHQRERCERADQFRAEARLRRGLGRDLFHGAHARQRLVFSVRKYPALTI